MLTCSSALSGHELLAGIETTLNINDFFSLSVDICLTASNGSNTVCLGNSYLFQKLQVDANYKLFFNEEFQNVNMSFNKVYKKSHKMSFDATQNISKLNCRRHLVQGQKTKVQCICRFRHDKITTIWAQNA
ncbi:hypothetical protein ENBRE01_1636 [Enteropsectra breve]|nr:hypothetical protein ENBRE01_1636 [Enteropsectra breve]